MGLLNVAQVAEILNVQNNTIYKWADEERIPYIDLGNGGRRCIRFRQEDIDSYLENNLKAKKD